MKHVRAAAVVAAAVLAGSLTGASSVSAAPARPDLVVTGVTWAPTALVAGQAVRFTATVANRGTAATPAGVVIGVGFQVDGVLRTWSDDSTASLAPGAQRTLTATGGPGGATWAAVTGEHRVRAFVDDAHRIAEASEGNNVLDRTLGVAAGLALRLRGTAVATTVAAAPRDTVTATSMSGNVFAGCFNADHVLVAGSERYLQPATVGNDVFAPGAGPFGSDGLAQVPASTASTQLATRLGFGSVLRSYQGHFPFTCADGATADFTRFQATSVRTTRWLGTSTAGAEVGRAVLPVDVDLDVVP